jgi:hypothetical protein
MNNARRRTKRLVMLAAILMVGMIGREFFNAFYVFRELLFVLSLAALVVLFAAVIVVLGIVFHSAWQNLVTRARKTNAGNVLRYRLRASSSRPLRGVYERENRAKA